jgi:hypothetical protein
MIDLKHPERRDFLRAAERNFPTMYRAYFGRKFLLPNYRAPDYINLEIENYFSFDRCLQFKHFQLIARDEVSMVAIANSFAAMHYGKPTLFLERELGEKLLRTDLLADMQTGDIRWRWPAFKVVLPLGLISVERDGQVYSLTHFDICRVDPEKGIKAPLEIAQEIDRFLRITKSDLALLGSAEKFEYRHQTSGIAISTALDQPDNPRLSQTLYAVVKSWGDIRIADYQAEGGELGSPLRQDDKDRSLLDRLAHLVVNVLLFLSAAPLEYEPEKVIRPARQEGKHRTPGLIEARFVGQVMIRPVRPSPGPKSPDSPPGRHLASHWVSGHWKRQVHGVGRSERKLIWIMPYRTE